MDQLGGPPAAHPATRRHSPLEKPNRQGCPPKRTRATGRPEDPPAAHTSDCPDSHHTPTTGRSCQAHQGTHRAHTGDTATPPENPMPKGISPVTIPVPPHQRLTRVVLPSFKPDTGEEVRHAGHPRVSDDLSRADACVNLTPAMDDGGLMSDAWLN